MFTIDDTIAAIATPLGESGIGIVRLSGPDAQPILKRLFAPTGSETAFATHRLYYGHIMDPTQGGTVDEVLASYMQAPKTYTRQDVVEINCHGGTVAMQRVLALALGQGARLARPGEFTLRAFINGRLDLAQSEAVLDIIQAKTEAGLRVAVGQLRGRLSRQIGAIRQRLLRILAYLEAIIDFSDDVPEQDIGPDLAEAEAQLGALCAQAERGLIYRQGIRTAIVGRPNVGKSSLLNALLRSDRAIVTPIPGTTRDTLEETINLGGIPLCLVDTAGISPTEDMIERIGIERSQKALQQADLVLFVLDGSAPLSEAEREIVMLLEGKEVLLVVNKIDLPQQIALQQWLPQAKRVHISALDGTGLETLEQAIRDTVLSGQVKASDTPLVSNPRHQALLQRALAQVRAAQKANATHMPADFTTIDIRAAIDELGELTGETASEQLLETIFEQFCIGK